MSADSDITLGELGRRMDDLKAQIQGIDKKLDAESHSMRNKVNATEGRIAVLDVRVDALEGSQKTWHGAIAGALSAGVIGALQWLAGRS